MGNYKKDPIEIRVLDPGINNEYHFRAWVEDSESTENTDKEMDEKSCEEIDCQENGLR